MIPRTFTILALVAVLAPHAEAQRAREEDSLAGVREELEARGRELLHRGAPLDLVGVGVGAPETLARTPALARASFGASLVDREELAARKLALYEGGARFDAAPRPAPPAPASGAARRERYATPGASSAADPSAAPAAAWGGWAALLGLCAVAAGGFGAARALRQRRLAHGRRRA